MLTTQLFLVLQFLAPPFLAFVLEEGVCKQKCEQNRGSESVEKPFTFTCQGDYYDDSCGHVCSFCPPEVCDEYELSLYQYKFYCPPKVPGQDPYVPQNKTRYKGKCKDRCDKGRAGGFHDFRLNCTSRYTTKQEEDLCLIDCNLHCPADVCYENSTISCKEDKLEVQRIQKEKNDIEHTLYSEHSEKRSSIFFKHEARMITLSVLLVIVILVTTVFVWCTLRTKRVAPEVVDGRTLSMQETHSVRELSSSETSASNSTLQQQPVRRSLPKAHQK